MKVENPVGTIEIKVAANGMCEATFKGEVPTNAVAAARFAMQRGYAQYLGQRAESNKKAASEAQRKNAAEKAEARRAVQKEKLAQETAEVERASAIAAKEQELASLKGKSTTGFKPFEIVNRNKEIEALEAELETLKAKPESKTQESENETETPES